MNSRADCLTCETSTDLIESFTVIFNELLLLGLATERRSKEAYEKCRIFNSRHSMAVILVTFFIV